MVGLVTWIRGQDAGREREEDSVPSIAFVAVYYVRVKAGTVQNLYEMQDSNCNAQQHINMLLCNTVDAWQFFGLATFLDGKPTPHPINSVPFGSTR